MEPRNSELGQRGGVGGFQAGVQKAEREKRVSDRLLTCEEKPERAWGWVDLGSGSPPRQLTFPRWPLGIEPRQQPLPQSSLGRRT